MSLRDQLPPREHYTSGTRAGSWRHAPGRRTPAWPRWQHEGTPCPRCDGTRTTYKFGPRDTGLTTRKELLACINDPDREVCEGADDTDTDTGATASGVGGARRPLDLGEQHAGDWICSGPAHHQGDIWFEEVLEGPAGGHRG